MKKLFVLFVLVAFLLVSCAPALNVAQFVQLPDATRTAITIFVVTLVGLLFNYIATLLPWTTPFLSKYKDEISLVTAAALVGFIENALPSAYPEISVLVVQLIFAVLVALKVFQLFAKAGVRGFRNSVG